MWLQLNFSHLFNHKSKYSFKALEIYSVPVDWKQKQTLISHFTAAVTKMNAVFFLPVFLLSKAAFSNHFFTEVMILVKHNTLIF